MFKCPLSCFETGKLSSRFRPLTVITRTSLGKERSTRRGLQMHCVDLRRLLLETLVVTREHSAGTPHIPFDFCCERSMHAVLADI